MHRAIKKGLIVGLGFLLQILITLYVYLYLGEHIQIINILYGVLGIILVLGLIKNSKHYSYTLPWIIILLSFPLVGTLMYFIIGRNKTSSKLLKSIVESEKKRKKYLIQDDRIRKEFQENSRLRYLSDFSGYPVTKSNRTSYYPSGEEAFQSMLAELEKAEKFIFLEYFIVGFGTMWNSVLQILEKKVKQGLDVRIMYDDFGCIAKLRDSYAKELEEKGIQCVVFNQLNPNSGVIMNHRDHRKILVIDGRIAFSGGMNIADEYINVNSPYGHWKDNGIKVEGEAVWNYTVMFLTMWNAIKKTDKDFTIFKHHFKDKIKENGYIAPYGDTPLDSEITGEDIYLNIINQAHHYVYIFTPYLIIDTDIINALNLAAKRGVDVRIIIPGIPDKKMVYILSESYIESLVNAGVKVYKYTPGFLHAKVFISDDHIATVGTINLDYRSLYLHFECGLYLEDAQCIKDIKKDVEETIKKSHQVTKKEATPGFLKNICQAILRIFAPLM